MQCEGMEKEGKLVRREVAATINCTAYIHTYIYIYVTNTYIDIIYMMFI